MSFSHNQTNFDVNDVVEESESRHISFGATEEDEEDDNVNNAKLRSVVWEHFTRRGGKAYCKHCPKNLTAAKTSGTSSLRRHLISICQGISAEERAKLIENNKDDLFNPATFRFDPEVTRSLLNLLFIDGEVPFSLIENRFWEPAMRSLRPEYRAVGRQTLRDDCVRVFGVGSDKLLKELEALDSRVSFTSDVWTSNTNVSYLCITAHYIDAGFNFHKKILAFKRIPYPHTGVAIANLIEKLLVDWNLVDKLFAITLDNCSANDNAMVHLERRVLEKMPFDGRHLHMRCGAHILNLIVQDGISAIKPAVKSIRKLLRHIDSSGSRLQVLNAFLHELNLSPKRGLRLDCKTRWNSTFEMLREALQLKEALSKFGDSSTVGFGPTQDEWNQAEEVTKVLEAFQEATKTFLAVRKPSSHTYIKEVWGIRNLMLDDHLKNNTILQKLAENMQQKFSKYWEEPNLILTIATVFDPRYKLAFVQYCFQKAYGDESQEKVDEVYSWLKKYYGLYETYSQMSCQVISSGSSQSTTKVIGKRKLDMEFAQFESENLHSLPKRSELDDYFEKGLQERSKENFDILQWWRKNSELYPTLAKMARDFLAVQVSSVASESTFSGAGRLTDNLRSSLADETIESLLCSKDWLGPKEDVFDLNSFRPFFLRDAGESSALGS